MNIIIKFLGWFGYRLECCKLYYLRDKNANLLNIDVNAIGLGASFSYPEHIKIGGGTYCNACDLCASPNAKIVIGENCMIANGVYMRTDEHGHKSIEIPMIKQGHYEKDIIIGNDVWICHNAQITAGVKIADGCIICAGAVVTKDTIKNGMYGGVPAKLIQIRG